MNLRRHVGRRESRGIRNGGRLLAREIEQNDLPIEGLETIDPVEQPRNRILPIRPDLAIETRLPFQGFRSTNLADARRLRTMCDAATL